MYNIKIGENSYQLEPGEKAPHKGKMNGAEYELDIAENGDELHIIQDHKSYTVFVSSADYENKTFELMVNGNLYQMEAKDKFDLLLAELGMENLAGSAVNDLKAPMPGMVLNIAVKAGDEVKKGDPLIVLEAMKMENILKAMSDAKVKSINAEVGKAVDKNQVLIEFVVG